ncbi:MAG: oxaloacetate-decarboxylating malate dehydrogenase [Alphaproteobacteria bacterium]|nr:oxaloacetate-decarboxylating malate dehydrogenase [Alphaproteobacteria bacterium]
MHTKHRGNVYHTSLRGTELLSQPLLNKGTGFSRQERETLGLLGLLPPHIATLSEQLRRTYEAFRIKPSNLEKHIYLRALQDRNETLFYRLLVEHLPEMLPIIYTPVVAEACERFSEIYRRPRGLFIAYPDRHQIDDILANWDRDDVEVIVVTDGERVLGVGDQGAGGMGIPIGKLSLYTACGGIDPDRTLPIFLDVGTDNRQRLDDPLYIGWQHERVRGAEYDAFLDALVDAVARRWPKVLLQFEDFAQQNAGRLLHRYRDRLCMFNDDIQGTASVALGTLMAAGEAAGLQLRDQTVVVVGAGSAGCGIAEEIVAGMRDDGLSDRDARDRIFMVDRPGLLHTGIEGMPDFQAALAQPRERLSGWTLDAADRVSLLDVMRNAGPTALIGVSGQPGLFTEAVIREFARQARRPIVFPLSNPNSRAEAQPEGLIRWTDGRALVATGSPFADVVFDGRTYPIAQCNNAYIFPGLGLAVVASGATRVTDGMLMAASRALAAASADPACAGLLPPLAELPSVSVEIAFAVARQAQADGVAEPCSEDLLRFEIERHRWHADYPAIEPVDEQAAG